MKKYEITGIYAPKDGRSGKPPVALEEEADRSASAIMSEHYKNRYRVIDSPPPIKGGDYGDLAKQQRQAEAARKRAALCR